ncbi:TIGR02147 family protein, partial [Vibrio sp. FNV 38]|nr:TIGR02147 family protein [Vibrio sp. FNV 38]
STPEDVRDLAIGKYHRNMLGLAEEALALPLDRREFNGLTVSIPSRLLPQVKDKIRAFRTELNELLSRETEPGEVFQFNVQFFPLTQRTDS